MKRFTSAQMYLFFVAGASFILCLVLYIANSQYFIQAIKGLPVLLSVIVVFFLVIRKKTEKQQQTIARFCIAGGTSLLLLMVVGLFKIIAVTNNIAVTELLRLWF